MDSLILTFNKEQYNKYLELLENRPEEIPIKYQFCSIPTVNNALPSLANEIIKVADSLLKFGKSDSFFESVMSKEEIDLLIPAYYSAVRRIDALRLEIYTSAHEYGKALRELDRMIFDANSEYSSFLPYKASLINDPKFSEQIKNIECELLLSISRLENEKREISDFVYKIDCVCDNIIPEFFENSKIAIDSPKFKNFNQKNFFKSINILSTKIKNLI